jgi:hypothetical protein
MYKLPSYNQWMEQSKDMAGTKNQERQQIGELIRTLNSPQVFQQRIDGLIALREMCQSLRTEQNRTEHPLML